MATRKNRPVLYELVHRNRRTREPSRRRGGPVPASEPAAAWSRPATPQAEPEAWPPRSGRSVQMVDGQLHVRLGWPGMLVVGVGAVFVLYVAFQAGMRYATSVGAEDGAPLAAADSDGPETKGEPPIEPPLVPAESPAESVAASPAAVQDSPQEEPKPAPPRFEFKEGYHYVVIQHFPKSRMEQAKHAARYLRDNGVMCVVVPGADVRLIATEPFLLEQEDRSAARAAERRCNELKKTIRELGKEYAKQHGYAFEQCYELQVRR